MPTTLKERRRRSDTAATKDRRSYDLRDHLPLDNPEPPSQSSRPRRRSDHPASDDDADPDPPDPPLRPLPHLSENDDLLRLVFKPEVLKIVGLSFTTLWEMIGRGEFPMPRDVRGRTAWLRDEVATWIRNLPVKRYKAARVRREHALAARHRPHRPREGAR
jgi:prophage regulatory protein